MLERERDEAKRASNVVTFASVCRPLATLLGSRNDPARWHRVERLVDRLLSGASDEDITVYRIQQSELDAAESWRVPLKAPEIFGRYSQLPNVKRLDEPFEIGVAPILGDKRWFVVSDVSDSVSDAELKEHGVERQSVIGGTRRYRFVEGALGWRGPIESRFLARAVRGPKAQPRRVLSSEDGNLVVMIPESAQLRGLKVLDYIRWGGTHKINEGAYSVSHDS